MNRRYFQKNGYEETIQRGIAGVRSFKGGISRKIPDYNTELQRLRQALDGADAIVIGAGAGLSTSAGYVYSGERFRTYFSDFEKEYGFHDMYSGGFYPYRTPEEQWGFWCRNIWINRYAPIPNDVYAQLLALVQDREYFVITTNVDHCFQRAGFAKDRLFYTQGDYGLFQSSAPSGITMHRTYDNEEIVRKMILSQGYEIAADNSLIIPNGTRLKMTIPSELIPVCPDDGKPMAMNLRADDSFVQDDGWYDAADRYARFLKQYEGKHILFLELGVGGNTPVIIKYPFWTMTQENPNAVYACLNYNEACTPEQIEQQSICINDDIAHILKQLMHK